MRSYYLVSVIFLSFFACNSGQFVSLNRSPLVFTGDPSTEIDYMSNTILEERAGNGSYLASAVRAVCLVTDADYRNVIVRRDSMRITRVWQLIREKRISGIDDKFNAAIVLMHHPGNLEVPADTTAFLLASAYFRDVAKDHADPHIRKSAMFYAGKAFRKFEQVAGRS